MRTLKRAVDRGLLNRVKIRRPAGAQREGSGVSRASL